MSYPLLYTVQPGDTYYLIAANLAKCAGVTYQQIEAANPGIPPESLNVGDLLNIPDPKNPDTVALVYTVLSGDTYSSIATGLNAVAGVSYQSIENANPTIPPENLKVGDVLNIPSSGAVVGGALIYTVQGGDTYSIIATNLAKCVGIEAGQIETANPSIPPESLAPGDVLNIPDPTSPNTTVLLYTVQQGDTYSTIATGLNRCAGISYQSIEAANPGIPPEDLEVGDQLTIPEYFMPAPNMGYWNWTWSPSSAPDTATLGMAFSGYADPTNAIQDSAAVMGSLIGKKFISLGGGNENGRFTAAVLDSITAAITSGSFAGYDGIAYDVEEGDSGLATAFQDSFVTARQSGFIVLVTVSHSAPYGIADAAQLMQSFFADANIDILSPQLYTSGNESYNDYSTTAGVEWSEYATARAAVVPSVVYAYLYSSAQEYFAGQGVSTEGYVQWNH